MASMRPSSYNATSIVSTTIIVGLGNPGPKYVGTRHNVGFVCLDEVAHRYHTTFTSFRCRSYSAEVRVHGRRVILAKPRTYMNLVGAAVECFVREEGIAPADVVAIYDDMDLPLGKVRIKRSGSHGGHNGMRSIITALGTDAFPRVRVGIGRPLEAGVQQSGISYVLGRFHREEEDIIGRAIELVGDAVDCILSDGVDVAMNRFN